MDGLLVLVLIGWILSQMSKKNKKPRTKPVLGVNKQNSAQLKAERAAKLYAEIEKRKAQQTEEKASVRQQTISEGESVNACFQMEEPFRGSIQAETNEGECVCDPELEHKRKEIPPPESVYAGEIGQEPIVDFSARGIVQGVVMSEVLTRPAQRVRPR